MSKLKKPVTAVASVFDMIGKKKVAVYAAASDYFLFMSLVPIMMLLVSLIRYLPFDEADVLRLFADAVPVSVYNIISSIVESIYRSGSGVITVSVLLTLFSASGAMRAIMKGLDAVYEVERRENVFLFFSRAYVYMLILIVIIILSLVVMVYGSVALGWLHSVLPESGFVEGLFSLTKYMRYLLGLAILTLSFILLYRWVPAGKHRSACQWPGALFCAVAWVGFSWVFSLYVSISDKFGAYGYIGTIMVAMMWMYYCFMFLLIGGCINAVIEKRRAMREAAAEEEAE
ncbi:MAG: YihY/virulence factor BrkB family protein [Oscillospiraceae bacterium]|nr:YihY/virulence factor BrkB family protein [Oscillospiraceae bacterium]